MRLPRTLLNLVHRRLSVMRSSTCQYLDRIVCSTVLRPCPSEPLETLHQRPGGRQVADVVPDRVLPAGRFGQLDRVLVPELRRLRGQQARSQVRWFGFGGGSVGAARGAGGEAAEEAFAGLENGQVGGGALLGRQVLQDEADR